MIQRKVTVDRETPARVSVMPHITCSDDNGLQPDRGGLDRVTDGALGGRSAVAQRARATQNLASLGEMTGG